MRPPALRKAPGPARPRTGTVHAVAALAYLPFRTRSGFPPFARAPSARPACHGAAAAGLNGYGFRFFEQSCLSSFSNTIKPSFTSV